MTNDQERISLGHRCEKQRAELQAARFELQAANARILELKATTERQAKMLEDRADR